MSVNNLQSTKQYPSQNVTQNTGCCLSTDIKRSTTFVIKLYFFMHLAGLTIILIHPAVIVQFWAKSCFSDVVAVHGIYRNRQLKWCPINIKYINQTPLWEITILFDNILLNTFIQHFTFLLLSIKFVCFFNEFVGHHNMSMLKHRRPVHLWDGLHC